MSAQLRPEPRPEPLPLRATLLDGPKYPLETLWVVWEQSRHDNPLPSPKDLHNLNLLATGQLLCTSVRDRAALQLLGYPSIETKDHGQQMHNVREFHEKFMDTVTKLLSEEIPCTENLTYVFQIENMPISLREQLVRHRIGTKIGPRMGADIVPDLAESSWWSQTMRVLNMGRFYDDGHWVLPESIKQGKVHSPHGTVDAEEVYRNTLNHIQSAYNVLVEGGIPVEDARQIIPLGVTHRMTWEVNIKALCHIIGKRSCWISQRGMWEDLILQMVDGLCEEVEFFRNLVNPPCFKKGSYGSCPFTMINEERITGADGFPPCPLWLHHNADSARTLARRFSNPTWDIYPSGKSGPVLHGMEEVDDQFVVPFPDGWVSLDVLQAQQMKEGREAFRRLWNRDVDTGEPLGANRP